MKRLMKQTIMPACGVLMMGLTSCTTNPGKEYIGELKPISRKVDLERFMGDWYVHGNIPVFIEKEAFNAKETYELAEDGTIPTTFSFNKGALDGPLKIYKPKGFVYNEETNAEWRMQFLWPFKAAFLITYLSEDYETVIVGVPNRKYAWIMARTKDLPEERYQGLVAELKRQGHDVSNLRRVPHG
jgi:apolipoprotein D and lipocalin family protein